MTAESKTPDYVYLLNAMENAAAQLYPADHGYAAKRQAVLDDLRAAQETIARLTGERDAAFSYLEDIGKAVRSGGHPVQTLAMAVRIMDAIKKATRRIETDRMEPMTENESDALAILKAIDAAREPK